MSYERTSPSETKSRIETHSVSISDDTTQKIRQWYKLQSEKEGLLEQMKPFENAVHQLKNHQKNIEKEIIQSLQAAHLEERPLQIGEEFFRVQRESSWTPLTFTWLQQALISYFGNMQAAQDCYNQIRQQREQNFDYKLSRFTPRNTKKIKVQSKSNKRPVF